MNTDEPTVRLPAVPTSPPPVEIDDSAAGRMLEAGLPPVTGMARWTPPAPEELSRLLPGCRVEALIGCGGMGAVYRGVQEALDRAVAIKILPPEVAGGDEHFVARFKQEAKAMARLSHPNIVAIHDFGETADGLLYFVMEFIEGTDLAHLMRSESRLSPSRAAAIITQVCDALEFSHEKGIIHRDIKPSNIMVDKRGRVKVADFGLAKTLHTADAPASSHTMSGTILGTRAYMAPEQALGKPVDHRADIYSVGAMFYEMLTGEPPHGAVEPPSRKIEIDVRMDHIVLKALAQEPERRYQHASEVKSDVTEATRPAPARRRRPALPHLLASAALLTGLGLGAWFWQRPPSGLRQDAEAAATPAQEIDLLALTDPARDRIVTQHMSGESTGVNEWSKTGGTLSFRSDGDQVGKIAVPVALRATDYELDLGYRCTGPASRFNFDLPLHDGRIFPIALDERGGQIIFPTPYQRFPVAKVPREGRLVTRVHDTRGKGVDHIVITLDGREVVNWRGLMSNSQMAADSHPAHRDQPLLMMFCYKSSWDFTSWKLRVFEGAATALPPAMAPTAIPPSPDALRDARKLLAEARAHGKAGESQTGRDLVEKAIASAGQDLGMLGDAVLLLGSELDAPQRAAQLAADFAKAADAEHPLFAAVAELRAKLAPRLKAYQARLPTAAKLVAAQDDEGERRELKAALELVPDGREALERLEQSPVHLGRPLSGRTFTNPLGHRFMPVDGLPNVLFSRWETRVKDYAQFVKETKHDMSQPRATTGPDQSATWQQPGFEQTGDHPVVMVARDDANAFCDWLTKKERAAGRLLPGQVYRLPTDREWSAAMGVHNEPGEFPEDREFPQDVFPWGKSRVPPHNAENLKWQHDEFPNTAPVGSGTPNSLGIYDLLGNVAEMCADPWVFCGPQTTVRGHTFSSPNPSGNTRTTIGDRAGRSDRAKTNIGFRCVLDLKTEDQRRVQLAMEAAVDNLHAFDRSQKRSRQEIHFLVNDEMVLLDLSRWGYIADGNLREFSALPITHLFGRDPSDQDMEDVAKMPLRVLGLESLIDRVSDKFLHPLRDLSLEWLHLEQNNSDSGGMKIRSLAAVSKMKLRGLSLSNFPHLETLEPLRGMPLEALYLRQRIPPLDLAPVKDEPLRRVNLPGSVTLEQLLQACDWWGAKAKFFDVDRSTLFANLLIPEALAGHEERVKAVKLAVEAKLRSVPSARVVMDDLNSPNFRAFEDFAVRLARHMKGDRTAFEGAYQSFNGHTYLQPPDYAPPWGYDEAKEFARKLGGHLLVITTQAENDFVMQQFASGVFRGGSWLGFEPAGTDRKEWVWATGEKVDVHQLRALDPFTQDQRPHIGKRGDDWVWPLSATPTGQQRCIIEWDTPTPEPPKATATGMPKADSPPDPATPKPSPDRTKASSRQIAGRILALGGIVGRPGKGQRVSIQKAADIPSGEFDIEYVELPSSRPADAVIREEDFLLIAQCAHLTQLRLSRLTFTPAMNQALENLKKLRELTLREAVLDGDTLRSIGKLMLLQDLQLDQCPVSGPELAALAALPGLRSLALTNLPLDRNGLAPLADFRALQSLALHGGGFLDDDGLRTLPTTIKTLERLQFSALNKVTGPGWDHLATMPFVREVEVLAIADSALRPLCAALARMPGLEKLTFNGAKPTDADLASLATAPRLRELRLQGTRATEASLDTLTQRPGIEIFIVPHMPDIKVTGFPLRAHGLRLIVEKWPKLAQLGIQLGADVTPGDIASLAVCKEMYYLTFTGDSMTDAHAAALPAWPKLRTLSLASKRLTAAALPSAQKFPAIESLTLQSIPFTDADIPAFSGFTRLIALVIPNSKFSTEGLARLRKALPGCNINSGGSAPQ